MGADGNAARQWALSLYRRSVLKQQKFRALREILGDVSGKRCLDVGGDNGVISLLLRKLGGEWDSADLDRHTVDAISTVTGTPAQQIADGHLPFPDAHFDVVVIVDMLEHLDDDRGFVIECARLLRPGGTLIANVPHDNGETPLRRLRLAVGLTDEKHGHVRPGYGRAALTELLAPEFEVVEQRTYLRSFSELLDILLNAGYEMKSAPQERSKKGTVITQDDWSRRRGSMRLLTLLYPVFRLFVQGDLLLFRHPGYRLLVRATRAAARGAAAEQPAIQANHGRIA